MNEIFEWLSQYNVEYDVVTKRLYIKKEIPVADFMLLRKIIEPYKHRIEDIIVESR